MNNNQLTRQNYGLTYAKRSTPDVSYDADPNTGVYVYDYNSIQGATGWWDVGGTSAGAPSGQQSKHLDSQLATATSTKTDQPPHTSETSQADRTETQRA